MAALQSPLLGGVGVSPDASSPRRRVRRPCAALGIAVALLALAGVLLLLLGSGAEPAADRGRSSRVSGARESRHEVESGAAAVAADDGRCSEVGAAALRAGGHAVDAAVAAALCLGVVHPMSSGLGGGAFIVVRDAASGDAVAFDARETAPAAATPIMYAADPTSKFKGALAMGVPGELAGLHAAWSRYGRLPWKSLFAPAIALARDGYTIVSYVANALKDEEVDVLADPGLRAVFAPGGRLLRDGELCRNPALADVLEALAEDGIAAFYGGAVGERLVEDVRRAGGILTVEDLKGYKVGVSKAMEADAMGFTFLGMPPPSSGTVGLALVLNVLGGYKSTEFLRGFLGVHRLIEAVKHMLAVRMDLGDPGFVNVAGNVSEMMSPEFADKIRRRIADNTTFPPAYYLAKWSQLRDNGTSHLCVVDGDRNAVAMTTTVNYYFGAHVLSPSTGIVLNNEMDDFSVPSSNPTPDQLPPAPANFIAPGKRPLSSMTPAIILKDRQLAGVVGASGGTNIITAVTQVFLNHFVVGMSPLAAVQSPRVYHKLVPNVVRYEDATMADGEVIEFSTEAMEFLRRRGHVLESTSPGAVCQLIVQDLLAPVSGGGGGGGENVFRGMLTAVSDPRKDGSPAGV
ncbi:glutathione hydrolase 3 [Aegilops tauschii subsp. strangulata]|uniref:Glutathione hydrolase n=3 Tax=Aegilops tauschii subsp. strangulata TaxID=200361 RepID=A0A453DZQ4_AEGTS|nr:glutathione hydrolase 3 [Aegilops tauschii subsp. strangulata]